MTTTDTFDPQTFIDELFRIDQTAAVRVANKWGGDSSQTERYKAAWTVVQRQTVAPLCQHCEWPLLPGDEHPYCEVQLLVANARRISKIVDVDDDQDDDGCPHCGSHMCNTWDCQK